ncbi:MAG TPA: DUF1129 family protein [Atopostipes sp.]|nr:DUF1129 family protein [Atopostipes sp.]
MFNRKKKEQPEENTKSLDEVKKENQELYQELTNKNKDYMFQLNSRLDELDYNSNWKELVFNEMLQEIIAAQATHITARKLYGTVTEQADNIVGKKVQPGEDEVRSPNWQIFIDGALLMGGLFGIVFGISSWNNPENSIGLLQFLMNFILGGVSIVVLTKYMPKPGETKGFLKYMGATVVVILFWVLFLSVVLTVLPNLLNPALPAVVVLGLSALSLLGRWFFKRKYNVKGSFF